MKKTTHSNPSYFSSTCSHARYLVGGLALGLWAWGIQGMSAQETDNGNLDKQSQEFSSAQSQFKMNLDGDISPSADKLEVIGNNVLLTGNVRVLYMNYQVLCDTAMINTVSKDIEAIGNVRFYMRDFETRDMHYWEYDEWTRTPDVRVEHVGMSTRGDGSTLMRVQLMRMKLDWQADHVIGNLETGAMSAKNFYCAADRKFYVRGESAERTPKGRVEIKNAAVSTCPHFEVNEEHYGITAGRATLTPQHDYENFDETTRKHAMSLRRYWIEMSDNAFLRIWDVPVAWFPMLLLPPIEDLQKYATINVGYTSQMGVKFQIGKQFHLCRDPEISTKPMVAYFSKRGWGVGDETIIKTEESWTQIIAFGMHDKLPYGVVDWQEIDHASYNQLKIPRDRYELRIENVTHITPRLDFRGRLEAISDISFVAEYFSNRVIEEGQATFANLEYQFERFIPSIYVRPRVNTYMAENQDLPEIRLDVPRQHLIGGLYYQGQNSVNWMYNRWRDYAYSRTLGAKNGILYNLPDPATYNTFRWDTLQMFNYPIKLGWLNLIPRAGMRLTYYKNTSEASVDQQSLQWYKWSQNPYTTNRMIRSLASTMDWQDLSSLSEYDQRGGSRFRIIGEFGLEANTKISRSWSNVKNAFWELDGLRHVFVPYVNFTSNPVSTVSANNLYFFDEVDRYDKQQYLRIGARNSLSTRRGPYYRESIVEVMSMENYFDLNLARYGRKGSMADFGTIFKYNPFPKLQFSSALLLNLGGGESGAYGTIHDGRIEGGSMAMLGAWYNTLHYQLMDDLAVFLSYNFQNNYYQNPYYSMGSSFSEILTGRIFPNQYYKVNEIRGGFEFRVPYDDATLIGIEAAYDFQARLLRDAQLRLTRNFHCWDATLTVGRVQSRNVSGGTYNDNNISFSIGLSPNPGAPIRLRNIDLFSTPYDNR